MTNKTKQKIFISIQGIRDLSPRFISLLHAGVLIAALVLSACAPSEPEMPQENRARSDETQSPTPAPTGGNTPPADAPSAPPEPPPPPTPITTATPTPSQSPTPEPSPVGDTPKPTPSPTPSPTATPPSDTSPMPTPSEPPPVPPPLSSPPPIPSTPPSIRPPRSPRPFPPALDPTPEPQPVSDPEPQPEPVPDQPPPLSTPRQASIPEVFPEGLAQVGPPSPETSYARNIWDMLRIGERIYLGYGNNSRVSSAVEAGPATVVFYDLTSRQFKTPYTLSEDQIDRFRLLNGVLSIPGYRTKGTSDFSGYYQLGPNDEWTQSRTIPAARVFDIVWHHDQLYAAVEADAPGQATVLASSDGGKTWRAALVQDDRSPMKLQRCHDLIVHQDKLYAIHHVQSWITKSTNGVYVLEEGDFVNAALDEINVFPGVAQMALMKRATSVGDRLYSIAALPTHDGQWLPRRLYRTDGPLDRGVAVDLGTENRVPYDLLVRGETLFVLTAEKQANGSYRISVVRSFDGGPFKEVFYFYADTFARSFEENDGDFLFGLGTDEHAGANSAGGILRVKREMYR